MSEELYKSTIVEVINEINRTTDVMSVKSLLTYSFIIIDNNDTYNIIKVSQIGIRKIKSLNGIKKVSSVKYSFTTVKEYYNYLKNLEDPNEIINLLYQLISFVLKK